MDKDIQKRIRQLCDLDNCSILNEVLIAVRDNMQNMAKEMITRHEGQHKIWQGQNGYWYTYINEKGGRVLKKRKSRDDLEKIIIDIMRKKVDSPTVADVFEEWLDKKVEQKSISQASVDRYCVDFNRFFRDLKEREISTVAQYEVEDFLLQSIADFSLTAKAFSNLKVLVKGIFTRAKKKGLISFSVMEVLSEMEISPKVFTKVRKKDYEEVFMENELRLVQDYLRSNPNIENLGLLLALCTGVRVGELVAIKTADIEGNILHICRTESHYKENGKDVYVIKDSPKTEAGIRDIVIPTDCLWIIERIKHLNPDGEFLFMRDGSRIRAYTMRLRLHKVCREIGIHERSPHKLRKTYCSILLDHNVDTATVISLLGHTDISCSELHYHRNRKNLAEKISVLDKIDEFKV